MNDLVKYAFELVSNDQLSGPAWINETRFDILAQASPTTTPAQLHAMMRTLLADRFQLQSRREQKVLPHLALVLGKGSRLQAVEMKADPAVGTHAEVGRASRRSSRATRPPSARSLGRRRVERLGHRRGARARARAPCSARWRTLARARGRGHRQRPLAALREAPSGAVDRVTDVAPGARASVECASVRV